MQQRLKIKKRFHLVKKTKHGNVENIPRARKKKKPNYFDVSVIAILKVWKSVKEQGDP